MVTKVTECEQERRGLQGELHRSDLECRSVRAMLSSLLEGSFGCV